MNQLFIVWYNYFMRKIITTTMLTLDGVMQAPGGSQEDTAEGFKYGGWQDGYGNEEMNTIFDTKIQAAPFDLLLGHRTYAIFAGYWPHHKDEPRWGKPFDSAKKYVVSHQPIELPWDNSQLITGDIVAEIKKLKNSDGPDLLVYGSSNLIQTLLKNNLVDRMHLWTFPVTIGTGKKLFAEGTQPERFKLVDGKVLSTGLIFATYEPSEPLKGAL
jgi:dihydrofolate reductase